MLESYLLFYSMYNLRIDLMVICTVPSTTPILYTALSHCAHNYYIHYVLNCSKCVYTIMVEGVEK